MPYSVHVHHGFCSSGAYMMYWVCQNFKRFSLTPGTLEKLLSAPEIHRRFFERLLISHCCSWHQMDIKLQYASTSVKLTTLKEHFNLWPKFRKYAHIFWLGEKALWTFLLDTHFRWKWCGTEHTQWSGTQEVNWLTDVVLLMFVHLGSCL